MVENNGVDASVLRAALEAAGRAAPSESECEPVRVAMASEDFDDAAALCATLLRGRSATPQLLGAFCTSLFRTVGPACLRSLFDALRVLVGEGWERVACANSREKQCEAALNAALRDIATCWQCAASQPSIAARWATIARADALECVSAIAAFRAAYAQRWESPRFATHLSSIEALLRAVRPAAAAAPVSAPTQPQPQAHASAPARASASPHESPAAREPPRESEPVAAFAHEAERFADRSPPDEIVLPVTTALRELLDKLEAFDALLREGDALRAAIIADDVQKQIDHFDPRRFFPALFAAHIARRVAFRAALSEARQQGADEWSELEQLYRVDLHAFAGR